jgi:hypothetical protein
MLHQFMFHLVMTTMLVKQQYWALCWSKPRHLALITHHRNKLCKILWVTAFRKEKYWVEDVGNCTIASSWEHLLVLDDMAVSTFRRPTFSLQAPIVESGLIHVYQSSSLLHYFSKINSVLGTLPLHFVFVLQGLSINMLILLEPDLLRSIKSLQCPRRQLNAKPFKNQSRPLFDRMLNPLL